MRKHIRIIFLVCVSLFNLAQAQIVPDAYRQQQQQEMTRFTDSIHDDFVHYLEHLWTEYRLLAGEPSPRSIKPMEQPRLDTVPSEELTTESQIPYDILSQPPVVESVEALSPAVDRNVRMYDYSVSFYGNELRIALPASLAKVKLAGNRERHVARFWKTLVENRADQSIVSLDQCRRNMYLSDWGLFDLIRHLAATIYPGRPDEQAVLSVFLLDAMHYDARVGRMDNRLVMLIHTGSRLYDIPYVEIDTVRYYAFGELPGKGRIHTYDRQLQSADRPVSMHLAYSPRLGGALPAKTASLTFSGRKLEFSANRQLIDFYARYPQTELSVYANAAIEEELAAAIGHELRPFVENKNPEEALNVLLKFMQQGFTYQTDRAQFGREKNFFCEENFYYPANDCEDRAVLFARIVKLLLGYDVVLLEYPNHVATAVSVPGRKIRGHHVDIQGKRYLCCDPTSLGAAVGDLGREYRHKKANIILINT